MFLLGDLSSRTSTKSDFIDNDRPINTQHGENEVDTPILRSSLDKGSNRFGDSLLDICKWVNTRIVNGRSHNDKSVGRMTCYTHNSEIVVDYVLLIEPLNFQIISHFKVGDFTEYSHHAPISFALKTFTNLINDSTKERLDYKWDDKCKNDF